MVMEQTQRAVALEEVPACHHHWVIETANGRHSRGECRNCQEVRTFENSIYNGGSDDEE